MKAILPVTNAVQLIAAASLLFLLFSGARDAGAVVVKNLYDVEFPVPTQSSTVRTAVFTKGLEEVLIRVSGSRSILQNIDPGNASAYVQQFSYVEAEPDEDAAAGDAGKLPW